MDIEKLIDVAKDYENKSNKDLFDAVNILYDEYEKQRVRQNAEAWLQQAEKDVEMLKQTYTRASKFVVNGEGELETWAAQMTPEEFEEKIEKSFAEFKERFIKRLNGENNEND